MNICEIHERTPELLERLTAVWEDSGRTKGPPPTRRAVRTRCFT